MNDTIKVRNKKTGEIVTLRRKGGEQQSEQIQSQPQTPLQQRPSAMADLIQNPTTMQHPLGAVLRTLAGAGEMYQGIPASIALDLQSGQPKNILSNLGKVVTGQRPAQYGDVFRGAGVPEPLAAAGGLYTDLALTPGGAQGMQALSKGVINLPKNIAQAGKNTGNLLKSLFKFKNSVEQSKIATKGLADLKTTIGEAKRLAVSEVQNVPVSINKIDKLPQVAVEAIQKPEYGVEILRDGSLKPTIGNLDKVKEALGDLIGSKPTQWKDATKLAKQNTIDAYFQVRDAMIEAAKTVGKDLKKPLDAYHEFMVNFNKIRPALIDKNLQNVGNKLKAVFKYTSEPAYKEAWEVVSKQSPEIKFVMDSMKRRELLKRLLIVSPLAGGGASAIKKIKTGNW